MAYPVLSFVLVFRDIKTCKTNSHRIHFAVDEKDLSQQIDIQASIFLNYKHKLCLEYIHKLFHNQMGAMNWWAEQVNKPNANVQRHVFDLGVKWNCI